MAIAGNSSGKSKTENKDASIENELRNSTDLYIDEDVSEENNKIPNDPAQSVIPLKSDSDFDTCGLQLLEEELIFIEESIQRFLISTVGNTCSKVYDLVSKYGQKLMICSNNSILRKSATGRAVFLLLAGKVNVLTSDKSDVLNTLCVGDVFGEVSVLFDIPVTANIVAASDVTLVKLPKPAIDELFEDYKESLDMINWFIKRRYLPIGSSVDSGRVYRRLALQTFRNINLLHDWTEEMIKKLVLSFDKTIVTLYHYNSIITLQNDPLTIVFIVLKGDIQIVGDSNDIITLSITAEKGPFVFTEVALIREDKKSPVTIKALTNCQVIQLDRELVRNILDSSEEQLATFNEKVRLFQDFFKRLGHVYIKNEAYLHIEMLINYLKQSSLYAASPTQQIWRFILDSDVQELLERTNVILEVDSANYDAILVIRGTVLKKFHTNRSFDTAPKVGIGGVRNEEDTAESTDKVQGVTDKEGDGCKIIEEIDYLSTGSVISIKSLKEQSAYLMTKTECLILKLRAKTEFEIGQLKEAIPNPNYTENLLNMV